MRIRLLLAACLVTLATGAPAKDYPYETVPGDLTKTRIYTLDNGLRVYLSVNKEKPRIQTYIAVRTGSKNDPAETTGLAHYLEHLMFKGTRQFGTTDPAREQPLLDDIETRYEAYRRLTLPEERQQAYHEIDSVSQLAAQYFIPNEYDKLMAAIGAEGTNAYTSDDVTCYTEDIPANEVENWAKIQGDRFRHMVIRGFHTELEAVYEEYNIHLAYDTEKVYNALRAKLFPTHPYGTQTTIGTQEHLKNPSITNIKNYFARWYVPNNVAVCMAGDLDPDAVVRIIDRHFGSWQPATVPAVSTAGPSPLPLVAQPVFPAPAPLTAPQDTTVVGLEAETLWLGWRFDRAASLQADTLSMVDAILSNGYAGLLDLDIRQKMKMLEVYSGTDANMDHSMFYMAGTPKEGQTLDEVRTLLLDEIGKLKRGEFPDDLMTSVINNAKLNRHTALESNERRAADFVDAFINGESWEQKVGYLDRIARLTKQDIMDFASRHFLDNYVAVYKRQAADSTQKKIDKPAITPIPTNRDLTSPFVKDIQSAEVSPIEPRFVDFRRDLTFATTKRKLPLLYVQNTENGRFTLDFKYDFGEEADIDYNYAAAYIDYLGTDRLAAEQVRQQFYKLACSYDINVGSREIHVRLDGLSENMAQALALLEDLLQNARVDSTAFSQYIDIREKARQDNKLNQQQNFHHLLNYGLYGPYNPCRNALTADQLRQKDPQQLLRLLKDLSQYEHSVHYYGPMSVREVSRVVTKTHRMPKRLSPVPAGRHYTLQPTPENEILIAPYDAKNVYLRMVHNEQRPWHPEEAPVGELFNEYYGGGMNTIVFQELREARGLAYNAYAAYMRPGYKDTPEHFFTHVITQNDKTADCIRQFRQILDTIPQSESAFRIAKEALTKRLASQRTTKFAIINAWLRAQRLGIDYDLDRRVYGQLPQVTLQDIVRFGQRQMSRKPCRYILLGDEQELDMPALRQYGTVRRLTTDEIFGY